MALETDFLVLMTDDVKVAPRTGVDGYAKPTFGADVTYKAYVEQGAKLVVSAQGQEVTSGARAYLATVDQIATTSRVTLPTGLVPNQPTILRVDSLRDDKGAYATLLALQ